MGATFPNKKSPLYSSKYSTPVKKITMYQVSVSSELQISILLWRTFKIQIDTQQIQPAKPLLWNRISNENVCDLILGITSLVLEKTMES